MNAWEEKETVPCLYVSKIASVSNKQVVDDLRNVQANSG